MIEQSYWRRSRRIALVSAAAAAHVFGGNAAMNDSLSPPQASHAQGARPSRRERFFGGWFWLILKNIIGWSLIVVAFVAGPLVPGPGGIPLFLVGFALITFPGKRRLTARVLRGREVRFAGGPFVLISLAVAGTLGVIALGAARARYEWVRTQYSRGWWAIVLSYLIAVALIWLVARATPHVINAMLRLMAKARRKFRPWLRHHHIRLLPPRWRVRHGHEAGRGPFRLKDEILKMRWRR
jgi:hypothetical protein